MTTEKKMMKSDKGYVWVAKQLAEEAVGRSMQVKQLNEIYLLDEYKELN